MKSCVVKDILDALKDLDPAKEIKVVGTYSDFKIIGIFDGEFGVEIEIKEDVWTTTTEKKLLDSCNNGL